MKLSVEETVIDLEIIRQTLCSYGAKLNETCDCKFGVKHIYSSKDKIKKVPRLARGEKGCGCPEIRMAIAYLKPLVKAEKAHLKHVKNCSTCCSRDSFTCKEGNILHMKLYGR